MKTKILATIFTILLFLISYVIGYIIYYYPQSVIWVILPLSGLVLFMSIWVGIYNFLKK